MADLLAQLVLLIQEFRPAGVAVVTLSPAVLVITTSEPLSVGLIALTVPATGALYTVLLLFVPSGYTCPRPRFPPR